MKRGLISAFLALLLMAAAVESGNLLSRKKRATMNNCNTNPSNMGPDKTDDTVDDGDTMTLSCNSDQKILSCIWRHTDPITEKEEGYNDPGLVCTGGISDGGNGQCKDDTRVTLRTTESSCSIDVSNTEPTDTGRWVLTAVTLSNSGQTQVNLLPLVPDES